MRHITAMIVLLSLTVSITAQSTKQLLDFQFEGIRLNGVLNIPQSTPPKGIVLIVHGSGQTNAVAQEWHFDIRETLVASGYATYMWDKRGCGESEGTFDYNQPVHNSADEVIAAIQMLKENQLPGSETIGLWGISRAGWINPIVINKYQDIAFWISVSGVDEKENFNYLLEQNLLIDGYPTDSVNLLVNQLREGTRITHTGGSYECYLDATQDLRALPFMIRFSGGGVTEEGYYAYQKGFMKETLDAASGLQVYIDDFDELLATIDCPVLALFGENDLNVDWEKTQALYDQTMSDRTDLTIASFPDCNHNLFQCETGGFFEMEDENLPYIRCEGFLETMTDWLGQLD